jgi:PAS domain-containing protein
MQPMDPTFIAETSLRRAVDFVPQGLAVFDADLHLVASNARYRELLDLPPRLVATGTTLYDIALYVGRRGDLGDGDPVQRAAERVETLTSTSSTISQRIGKQGQTLEFHSSRLPDGGLVISFADVSARVDAEAALERANASLEGRVEERTATLLRVNSELETARKKADAANRDKTLFI